MRPPGNSGVREPAFKLRAQTAAPAAAEAPQATDTLRPINPVIRFLYNAGRTPRSRTYMQPQQVSPAAADNRRSKGVGYSRAPRLGTEDLFGSPTRAGWTTAATAALIVAASSPNLIANRLADTAFTSGRDVHSTYASERKFQLTSRESKLEQFVLAAPSTDAPDIVPPQPTMESIERVTSGVDPTPSLASFGVIAVGAVGSVALDGHRHKSQREATRAATMVEANAEAKGRSTRDLVADDEDEYDGKEEDEKG